MVGQRFEPPLAAIQRLATLEDIAPVIAVRGNIGPNLLFHNRGDGTFEEATEAVLGDFVGATRVIKVADVDGDGGNDILLGTNYGTQSQLFLSGDSGTWTNATADHLPAVDLSVGDLELGELGLVRESLAERAGLLKTAAAK